VSASRIDGPAGSLAVDDGGQGGTPVVFVHSLTGSSAHWSAQLDHLRTSRRAVAIDLRGHGRSDPPRNGDYAIASMAGDVAAVADALALERFALVGHSMGAGVALVYAGSHPARVERLMLVDSIADGTRLPAAEMEPFLTALESPAYAEAVEGYWGKISGPDAAIRKRLLGDLRATPREAVVAVLKQLTRFDPKPALAAWRGPTLAVVTPSNDYPFSLHKLGAGLPFQVMEGTGHWIQLDRPDEFNGILDRFLEE
jgi:pimeloyl-ACP methyl ester carboxylesterase